MSAALPGEHYCENHQGNCSHYAEENCTVCKLEAEHIYSINRNGALLAENVKLREAAKVAVDDYNRWVINEYGAVDGLDALAALLGGEG